jgi:hypothetical protein
LQAAALVDMKEAEALADIERLPVLVAAVHLLSLH